MNKGRADTLAFALAYVITHSVFLTAFGPLHQQLRLTAPIIPAIMAIVYLVCIIILFMAVFSLFGMIGSAGGAGSDGPGGSGSSGAGGGKNPASGNGASPGGPVRVTILSPREGLPLALGARIPLLARVDNPGQDAIWEVTSPYSTPMRGKLGMFNRNAVRATLVAAKPGDMAIEVNVHDRTGSSQSRVTVKVISGSTVAGVAMDASGRPIDGADIEICAVGSDTPLTSIGDPQGNRQLIVKSGSNGEFKFDGVPLNKPFIVRGYSKKHGNTKHFLPRLGKKANALMLTIENPTEDGVQVIFDESLTVEIDEVPGLFKKKDDIMELIGEVDNITFTAKILGGTMPFQTKWTLEEITGVSDGLPTSTKSVLTGNAVIDTIGPSTHTATVKIDPATIKAIKETRKPFRIVLDVTDMSMPQKKGKVIVGLENLTEPKAKFVKVADVDLNDTNRNMWKNLAIPVPIADAVEILIEINGGFDDIEVQGAATRVDPRIGSIEPIRVDIQKEPVSVKGKKQTFRAFVKPLRAAKLSPGEYTIFVQAKDKRKKEADDVIKIQVGAQAGGSGANNFHINIAEINDKPIPPIKGMVHDVAGSNQIKLKVDIEGGNPDFFAYFTIEVLAEGRTVTPVKTPVTTRTTIEYMDGYKYGEWETYTFGNLTTRKIKAMYNQETGRYYVLDIIDVSELKTKIPPSSTGSMQYTGVKLGLLSVVEDSSNPRALAHDTVLIRPTDFKRERDGSREKEDGSSGSSESMAPVVFVYVRTKNITTTEKSPTNIEIWLSENEGGEPITNTKGVELRETLSKDDKRKRFENVWNWDEEKALWVNYLWTNAAGSKKKNSKEFKTRKKPRLQTTIYIDIKADSLDFAGANVIYD